MKRNVSGLSGRNITFLKGVKYTDAYVIKYTKQGEYYALGKTDGTLYKFIHGEINAVGYGELRQFGIEINSENWRSFIDFDYKNPCSAKEDSLELIKSVLCLGWIICLILSGVCLGFSVKPYPYQVYGGCVFLGVAIIILSLIISAVYYRGDGARADLEGFDCGDFIDYTALNYENPGEKNPRTPNSYRILFLTSALAFMSMVFHVIEGRYYSVGGWLGVIFLITSSFICGIKLKKGTEIKGLRWGVASMIMITYLLATIESSPGAKLLQIAAAVICIKIFVKMNKE